MFERSAARMAAFVVLTAAVTGLVREGHAAGEFPYDKELILDAKRIGSPKRVPILTVESSGNAVIDLWCKTVPARVQVTDSNMTIETAPLPEQLPSMMVPGQCSPERMQADQDFLAALTQATEWRWQGSVFVLSGPVPLRFRASSH